MTLIQRLIFIKVNYYINLFITVVFPPDRMLPILPVSVYIIKGFGDSKSVVCDHLGVKKILVLAQLWR